MKTNNKSNSKKENKELVRITKERKWVNYKKSKTTGFVKISSNFFQQKTNILIQAFHRTKLIINVYYY